ncbi:MAG: hypothetical protein ACE5Z5_13460 [Candidatus Bathyarchaeia archaeon]
MEAEVEQVSPLWKAQDGTTVWWTVKLKGQEALFALHNNWFALFGTLKPGDKVRYEVSKAKLGKDVSQGVDQEGLLLFKKLRRVEEGGALEEEMVKLVEEGA